LAEALALCELLAKTDPQRYERAALRWLERFIEERLPPLTEVVLAASALAELRHGHRNVGIETLSACRIVGSRTHDAPNASVDVSGHPFRAGSRQ